MNYCVPDCNMEDDSRSLHDTLTTSNQKKSMMYQPGSDELMELLWRDGHVVMHSQTSRKPPTTGGEFKHPSKPEPPSKCGPSVGNSNTLLLEDETASWFQYPLDDPLEKEFCSEFFCEMPTASAIATDKLNKDSVGEGERSFKFGTTQENNNSTMPPPKWHATNSTQQALRPGVRNFSHFSRPIKALDGNESASGIVTGMGESSSMRTIGSSVCGSNQVQNHVDGSHTLSNSATGVPARDGKDGALMSSLHDRVRNSAFDTTVASSSGGSGCSFGRRTGQQSGSNNSCKRKGRDAEESECHSEEAEYESVEADKPTRRSASARKSRAAEVHNLSERRRRDRINEKMKALQELIPHCNKSDKASMLDEAIEYLKSLQLQVQIMWMGSGMAPMMFPGVQQYMSRMGIGMGHASMPSISSPIHVQRAPLVNQSMPPTTTTNQMPMCPPPLNPANFPTQMQNVHLPESYAHYLGYPQMQLPPQAMNLYPYGSHMMQQNQAAGAAGGNSLPTGGAHNEHNLNGQSG